MISPYPPCPLWLTFFNTSEVVLTFHLIEWKICALTNPKFHKLRFLLQVSKSRARK